ncbi:MAG TPA: FtsX-like permease family protein [Pyrinomonadaceae bacterium]|nr:FtsX-like permease family protein [Pyrinomonadaceae bacterium]
MTTFQLVKRNLLYYWRTNLAVVLGVATAVAVLAGALLVGDSVRASLRDLFLQRLGNTSYVIAGNGFFREQLAADTQADNEFNRSGFTSAVPLIALEGTVSHEPSKRRGAGIRVYGVDDRFWTFHRRQVAAPGNADVYLSDGLARELGASAGDSLLVRVQKFSEIPIESLHSKKEELGATLRLQVRQILDARALGEFSIQPQQTEVRAVFVSLRALQKAVAQENKANLILISENPSRTSDSQQPLPEILRTQTTLEDLGITLRRLDDQKNLSLEHESRLISEPLAKAANDSASALSLETIPVFSYLANSITVGERSIPYSLITGVDPAGIASLARIPGTSVLTDSHSRFQPIILNDWAARDLVAGLGDTVSVDYFLWHEGGRLETKTAEFELAAVTPIQGLANDRNLVPEYPGITGSADLSDWDPPFPVDLKRVRKQDENYWDQYGTTPKAFIPLAAAQQLWQTRFGNLTSIRLRPKEAANDMSLTDYAAKLRAALDPNAMGLAVIPVRAQGLAASRGATDFGEYFLYFSFFLVISALLLTALFFKLGVEQRVREIGVLQAMGFPAARVRKIFLGEGIILALVGSALGLVGALAYGQLIMMALRTWWVDAVGTTQLSLHVAPISLLLGAVGGIVAALICVVLTLRSLGKQSTRSLLSGQLETGDAGKRLGKTRLSLRLLIGIAFAALGVMLLIIAGLKLIGETTGFFGGGVLLLTGLLILQSAWLNRAEAKALQGAGWWPLSRLGFRNASSRPGRSVLCIALIASAAFIIVAVDAFRHREGATTLERKSGSGGFSLLAESLVPVVHDPGIDAGLEALNLTHDAASSLAGVTFERFRVRPGDDASCLNLYQPANPKIIAPRDSFLQSNRFAFSNSIEATAEEEANPWLLLNHKFADGAVPFIADANSTTYVLHVKTGEDLVLPSGERLRLVATLANSVLQSELIISEANFLRLFPSEEGYRLFLIDTPDPEQSIAVATTLEERLADYGVDVMPTSERLANFHRVENTYLSTFQMLGGLGLLLGTLGMAAVLLRNVLERRRELALLRAVGYNAGHLALMVIAENFFLLTCGLLTGTVCAIMAIAPVFFDRGGRAPGLSLGFLLLAVLISGLTASILATWATLKSPLLPALRAE